MSTLDVVAEVLREVAPRALRARQIAELAGARLPTASRTPETVVSRDLAIDVKRHGAQSRFLRVDRGDFVLKHALPTAFYNDNDEYVARWSRNLIEAGEIPQGVVDERSIKDLRPADVASYRQCHFFAGLGTWARALRDAGWPEAWPVFTGSCPCQGMSQAGRRLGFADPRHLWPDWFRLIDAVRPPFVFGEQVASKDGLAWLDLVLSNLDRAGYSVGTVDTCAAGFGAAHLRQRLYFVAVSREGGRQILRATRIHDLGQSRDNAARRGEAHDRDAIAVSDATVARRDLSKDAGTDRGDATAGPQTYDRWTAGNLEFERGGTSDETRCVPDAERVVRDTGRSYRAHGRPTVELDGHGEVDGTVLDDGGRSSELGDASFDGTGEHGRELPRDEGQHEEWSAPSDHAPVLASATYRPGDRFRVAGDLTWGGAVAGFWAEGVEWIYCRPAPGREDGCFRPAGTGIVVLADGTSPELAGTRAKRLRAIGNAIVLPQAAEFVGCAIETIRAWADHERIGELEREAEAGSEDTNGVETVEAVA